MKAELAFLVIIGCAMNLFAVPSFSGAEGWGSVATGGRGGRVVIVDNLNDAGPGSFRAAMCDTGKRIIVFRVSGVINLKTSPLNSFARIFQSVKNSNFTVAGQTSPGGIALVSDLRILGSLAPEYSSTGPRNFIIRFLRLRCTRNADLDCSVNGSTWDAAEYSDIDSMIIDHCDFSGGDDGTFDITRGKNWTVQWTTITNSTYRCGDHGGMLTAYAPTDHITLHHNLWAHHQVRGSLFHWAGLPAPEYGMIDYFNNVSYNLWDFTLMIQDGGTVNLNCAGNTFVEGPQKHYYSSSYPDYCDHLFKLDVQLQAGVVGYFNDNRQLQENGAVRNLDTAKAVMPCIKTATRYDMGPVTVSAADVAYEQVIHGAGLWYQDSMNRRIENEIRTRTGRHRNNVAPFVNAGPLPPADMDKDGMPDFWEDAMGLNKNDYNDNSADKDGDGYTNIEEYINDLALARLGLPYSNPVNPIPAEWNANPLSKLSISPAPLKVVKNDTLQLSVVKRFGFYDSLQSAAMNELSWSVTPSGVASVDGQGSLVALQAADSAKVICWLTSDATIRDTIPLTVWPSVNAYTLMPTDDAVLDYYEKDKNFGTISSVTIKSNPVRNPNNSGFDVKRGMFQFDLSSIPKNKTVIQADFSLWVLDHGFTTVHFPLSVVNMDDDWDESTVSWTSRSTPFAMSGTCDWNCDFDVANLYVAPVNTRQHWDLTTYIQSKMAQNTLSFLLYKFKVSDMWVKFASKDTSAALRPALRIVLANPAGNEAYTQEESPLSTLVVQPNPFNPVTCIFLNNVERTNHVFSLKIYNLQGQLVRDLTRDVTWKSDRRGVAYWHASGISSGVYAFRLQVGNHVWNKSTVLVR